VHIIKDRNYQVKIWQSSHDCFVEVAGENGLSRG